MCRQSEKVRPEQTWQTFASEDVSTMQTWSDEQQDLGGNKGLTSSAHTSKQMSNTGICKWLAANFSAFSDNSHS